MEEVNFRKQFEESCYAPALETLIEATGNIMSKDIEKVNEAFLDPLEAFLSIVLEHQERGIIREVKWLSISFLRTSMYGKKPVLLLEAYQDLPFIEKPVMACEINAAWMFPCWETFRENLRDGIRKQMLGRYVREPELKSYESQAVSMLLKYLSIYVKFAMRDLENRRVWQRLGELRDFTISYGEYLDWQYPIMVLKEEVDLFLCDEKVDLTYRRFQGVHYEDKEFAGMVLDDCVFRDCTFRKVLFQSSKLRHVRFVNCCFEECQFEDVELMGSSVLSSRLKKIDFQKCHILSGIYKEEQTSLFYCRGQFKWSLLEDVSWKETEITDEIYVDCQLFNVT